MSSNPHVKLVEKKNGKRLQLFAKNTDTIPYIVFLRVTTTDFRRTSKRPILKEIPAQSEVLLKTLILLEGKDGDYNPTFIVNEVTTNLSITKSTENFDIKINEAKLDTKVLLFTTTSCNLCEEALIILDENAFNFEDFNITVNNDALVLLKKELGENNLESVTYPALKIDDNLYYNIKSRQEFIDILKEHFK
nr:glutaredoxin domain-containing protein [uncultured Psychroserpens sp.]